MLLLLPYLTNPILWLTYFHSSFTHLSSHFTSPRIIITTLIYIFLLFPFLSSSLLLLHYIFFQYLYYYHFYSISPWFYANARVQGLSISNPLLHVHVWNAGGSNAHKFREDPLKQNYVGIFKKSFWPMIQKINKLFNFISYLPLNSLNYLIY